MKKIKNNVDLLTEKGMVVPSVRKVLVATIDKNKDLFKDAEKVKEGLYELAWKNPTGQIVYTRFEITVSNKSATDLAPKKSKSKVASADNDIEIE